MPTVNERLFKFLMLVTSGLGGLILAFTLWYVHWIFVSITQVRLDLVPIIEKVADHEVRIRQTEREIYTIQAKTK